MTLYALSPAQIERFWSCVQRSDGCWLWTSALDRDGYGRFRAKIAGRPLQTGAHRVAFVLLRGPIPDGLQLDHTCREKRCVRPDHLEPVTIAENRRRSDVATGRLSARSACANGHAFSEQTVYQDGGARRCRVCRLEAQRRYAARRRPA